MAHTYNPDWIIPILNDIEEFLRANDMRESSQIVAEAAAKVLIERHLLREPSIERFTPPEAISKGFVIKLQQKAVIDCPLTDSVPMPKIIPKSPV